MARSPRTKVVAYMWEGVDRSGHTMKGESEGTSIAFINTTLRRQGIRPTRVRKKPTPLFAMEAGIKPKDIAFMTRQMATMIGAGIPIAQSMQGIARGHEKKKMRELLDTVRREVESGTNLSAALRPHPQHFDRLYTSLVKVGEESGTLDTLMERIAVTLEKIEAIKSKIRAAMFYPSAVILVAIVIVSMLLLFVIPVFEDLFQGFGADLPTLTRAVVDFSRWFKSWWWIFLLGWVAFFAIVIYAYKRSPRMRYILDRLRLRIPVLGAVFRKSALARFARTLATMFGAGVPLVDSLDAVADAASNRVYQQALLEVRNEVATGRSLEGSLSAQTGLFPGMVLQMVATGEESGELELMLDKTADFYEREVDDAVAAISSLVEPFLIVFLGIIVGTVVIAMYLPIFKIAAVF